MNDIICTICQQICLPCLDGKNRKTSKGCSGKYMTPKADTLKGIQLFMETNPLCGVSRDFKTMPLSASDRFCLRATCVYELYGARVLKVETRKRRSSGSGNLGDPNNVKWYVRPKTDRIRTTSMQFSSLLSSVVLDRLDASGNKNPVIVADICGGYADVIYRDMSVLENVSKCYTNDLCVSVSSDSHLDATKESFVDEWRAANNGVQMVDWVITSPPYGANAVLCAVNAMKLARIGVALKLRLTFIEPCISRRQFLAEFPISLIIPMRRIKDAGKGRDSVCEAWFIWYKNEPLTTVSIDSSTSLRMGVCVQCNDNV